MPFHPVSFHCREAVKRIIHLKIITVCVKAGPLAAGYD